MTKKKKLKLKKRIYRRSQGVARYAVTDHKRRRARFMCQLHELSRLDNMGIGELMNLAHTYCMLDSFADPEHRINNWHKSLNDSIRKKVSHD